MLASEPEPQGDAGAPVRPADRSPVARALGDKASCPGGRSVTPVERRVSVPAELHRLAELRRFVREFAAAAGAAPSTVDDVVQAVDEAATNTITHGYAGSPGSVDVTMTVVDDTIVIRVEDDAPAFDPTAVPEPDMDVSALIRGPHGMGIRLMRLAMDDLDYGRRDDGRNTLIMTRSLAARLEEDR
jgi:serine/threonine-protein kinase RsbW